MKKILVLTYLFTTSLFAQMTFDYDSMAVVRNAKGKAKIERVTLTHLISPTHFDGLYFKIVEGKSDEAISFDNASSELLLKATTTYFHLMKARDYFINTVKSDYVKNMEKITVRVDIQNKFHALGHFAHDNNSPQFNNALTIPAGEGFPSRGVAPWGMEIWFAPSKSIHRSEVNFIGNDASMKALFENFRKQTHMVSLSRFLAGLVNKSVFSHGFNLQESFRLFGSSLIVEASYQTMDDLVNLFGRKRFHLESALVPEIIYHEYSHAALSDELVLSHSTAVIEGMADIFAGLIGKTPKLASKIKRYNTFSGKNAKMKQAYKTQFESGDYANADFLFGILWSLIDIVGEEKAPSFFYEMRSKIKTSSSIKKEFIEAVLQTCEERCERPFEQRIEILKLLDSRKI